MFILAALLLCENALADIVIPIAITASAINLSMMPSRQTCVAPCAVFFDASGTTSGGVTSKPFHEISYTWGFGDSGSGTWGDKTTGATGAGGQTSRNVACCAPVAAHVYETAGTYTATLTAYDGTNTASQSVSLVVTSADTAFTGTATTCVAVASLPVAGVGGCPSGSAVAQQSDWPTIVSTYTGTNKRVLLNGGEVYTGTATATLSAAGPGYIGSYGTGKAIIRTTATGTFSRLLSITTATDWRLVDLEFDGQSNGNRSGIRGPTATAQPNQLTVVRLYCHDIGGCLEFALNAGLSAIQDQFFVVDSTIQNLISTGSSNTHGINTVAARTAIMGNLLDTSNAASSEHMLRADFMNRGVVSNNQVQAVAASKEMIALRSPCANGAQCSGSYYPTMGLSDGSAVTQKVAIQDNLVKTNTYVGVRIGQINSSDSAQIDNIITERNYYQSASGASEGADAIRVQATNVTIRNELMDVTNGTGHRGTTLDAATAGMPAASGVAVYNTTVYSESVAAAFRGVVINTGVSGTIVKNNLGYAPSDSSHVMVSDSGSGTTAANNSSTAQVGATDPLFTATPPTTAAEFLPTVGSYAIDGGTSVPVWSDFGLNAITGTREIGAWQF